MCHVHARPCPSTGWALNRRFGLTSGTAAMLAQGGGGVLRVMSATSSSFALSTRIQGTRSSFCWLCDVPVHPRCALLTEMMLHWTALHQSVAQHLMAGSCCCSDADAFRNADHTPHWVGEKGKQYKTEVVYMAMETTWHPQCQTTACAGGPLSCPQGDRFAMMLPASL